MDAISCQNGMMPPVFYAIASSERNALGPGRLAKIIIAASYTSAQQCTFSLSAERLGISKMTSSVLQNRL